MRKRLTACLLIACACLALQGGEAPASALAGSWAGAISIMGREMKFAVHFSEEGGALQAKLDIPQQMAMGLPLTQVRREGDRVHFELVAGAGVAVFDGKVAADVIQGEFLQAGIKGTFQVTRGGSDSSATEPAQAEVLPYKAEEVSVASGEVRLAGTLTLPEGKGPFPAVILITGSGTQNRDEEIFGFRLFRVIADHLTRRGIAVLRCDDRGFGGQGTMGAATSADFAGDTVAQARFLSGRAEIDPLRIGLLGHSEGGLIAPMAGRRHPFAFMVLMAGTAVRGADVILEQLQRISRADGAGEEAIAEDLALQRRVFALLPVPQGESELEKILLQQARRGLEQMPAEQRQAISDAEAYVKTVAAAQLVTLRSPWFRYFLDYDPAPALAALSCPVLALFGGKDTQVVPAQNMPVMERAFRNGGNQDVTFKVFPEANHLFQKAETGSPSEYAALEKMFVPGFLETLSSWIVEKTKKTK